MTPKMHIKHAKHAFITRAVPQVQTCTPLLNSSDGSLDKSPIIFPESVHCTYLTESSMKSNLKLVRLPATHKSMCRLAESALNFSTSPSSSVIFNARL